MRLTEVLNKIESGVTDIAAKAGPLLAPIPAAYAVANATRVTLGWPVIVAVAAGAAIECLGIASLNTALMLRSYNREKRRSDPAAPFGLATGAAGFYVAVAVALTATVEPASALFPFLSLAGAMILALRADHRRRVSGIAEAKAEASRKRAERRNRKRTETGPEMRRKSSGSQAEPTEEPKSPEGRRERARIILERDPAVSGAELGRRLGVSGRQGRNLRAELLPIIEVETSAISGNGGGNGRKWEGAN
jgi:hypothetical protein